MAKSRWWWVGTCRCAQGRGGRAWGPQPWGSISTSCLTPTLGDDNPETEWAMPKHAYDRGFSPALHCLEEVASVDPGTELRWLQVSEVGASCPRRTEFKPEPPPKLRDAGQAVLMRTVCLCPHRGRGTCPSPLGCCGRPCGRLAHSGRPSEGWARPDCPALRPASCLMLLLARWGTLSRHGCMWSPPPRPGRHSPSRWPTWLCSTAGRSPRSGGGQGSQCWRG